MKWADMGTGEVSSEKVDKHIARVESVSEAGGSVIEDEKQKEKDRRTRKIIIIVVIVVLVLAGIIGLVLGLILPLRYVELEVWPKTENYYWDQPLIQFRPNDIGSWQPWIKRINDMLYAYETSVPEDPPRAPCTVHGRGERQMRSPNCDNAMRVWQPCTIDTLYGYPTGTPCIFLRLTHIHYWVPEPYNVTYPAALPPDMPDYIRQYMRQRPAHMFGDYMWVSCDGEYASDKENVGPLQYIPAMLPPGFPLARLRTYDRIPRAARSLPDREPGPLVAVFFENPRRGVLINVECRIWSRDIYYDRSSRYGRARFELYIE